MEGFKYAIASILLAMVAIVVLDAYLIVNYGVK